MSDINLVIMSGKANRATEARTTASGKEVTTVNMEVIETWASGSRKEYVRVVGWGPMAKELATVVIGDRILVQGRWASRSYENKDGVTVRVVELSATKVDFLDGTTPDADQDDLGFGDFTT